MRAITYAVGDIHGRLDLLLDLLERIEVDAEARGVAATVVFTGDYVDRGPDSYGVVERLIAGPRRATDRFLPLKGNHDELFVSAVRLGRVVPDWAWELFQYTTLSYGRSPNREDALGRHAGFLDALPHVHDDGRRLFVHAGIRPGVSLARQDPHDLVWIREEFLTFPGPLPRQVVHGHTIMGDSPVVTPNRISIDTGAYRSGRLTAAVLDGDEVHFLQAAGEPDRRALLHEAMLVETIAGRPVAPELQGVYDDFVEGRIDAAEMARRSARLGVPL